MMETCSAGGAKAARSALAEREKPTVGLDVTFAAGSRKSRYNICAATEDTNDA
jgi:hypothetical protein